MAEDAYGNYQAGLSDNVDYVTPQSGSQIQIGSGAPTVNTPLSYFYIDSVTGLVYVNPSQVVGAWVTIGGSWTHGAGSPITNGVSPTTYSLYTNDTDATFWSVVSGAWKQLV